MTFQKLLLVILFVLFMGNTGYAANVITGLTLHGVVQKLTPESGDDSLTVRDDSVYIVIDDVTRFSFVSPYSIIFGTDNGGIRWNSGTDKMQFNNDLSGAWSDIGTSSGLAAADFNDSLESQIEFSPKTHAKLDTSTAVRGAINDTIQANWAVFTAGGSAIKWRDSSYIYLDTANVLGGNTEIKAWLDTTAVRVPIADSTHGGATNATTAKTADTTDGGATRATTSATADSTAGGAARAESAQGLVAKGINSGDPADGEYLKYYTTGDTLGWDTPSGSGDVTDVIGGAGLVDDGNTGAITVDLQIGSWPLDLNADSVWLDSTEIVTWPYWTAAYDSVDNWNNLVNNNRDSATTHSPLVNEAKDSLTSWANEVNAATDSLAAWANQVNDNSDDIDELETDTRYLFTVYDPNSFWVADSLLIGIDPRTSAAITVTRIDISCDADPTTELDFDLMWADARIGNANRAVIDEMNTTAGVTTITSGFDDATVAANKCIYIRFNAEPDAGILDVNVRVTYTID